jgi:S1-C subfamily serine protease
MSIRMSGLLFGFVSIVFGPAAFGQTSVTVPTSIDSGKVIDAAGPEQRKALTAIYLIVCPNVGAGSGFLIDTGIVVTNAHVVGTCTEQSLVGVSTTSKQVKFSRIVLDVDRDIALLIPAEKLTNGLKLAVKDAPEPGTTVSTWGYPFLYNGVSPLLSVGYVSGYRSQTKNNKTVKHILVNGAFNHGNSGGPLLVSHSNEVIGVVVLTYNFYPPEVQQIIDVFMNQKSGLMYGATQADGTKVQLTEAQLMAMVLNEFYQKTQVMIGEAIAASELVTMIKEHVSELPAAH